MPFRQRKGYALNPSQLSSLQHLYDETWKELANGSTLDPDRAADLKTRVAEMILCSRKNGLTFEEIKEAVIQALRQSRELNS
jgi:hypothetical protein